METSQEKRNLAHSQRQFIAQAKRFFESHPELFTYERYKMDPRSTDVFCEGDQIRASLNIGAKRIIKLGGQMPTVLGDTLGMLEDFGLVFSDKSADGGGIYTRHDSLSTYISHKDGLSFPADPAGIIEISGVVALRSTMVIRRFEPECDIYRIPEEIRHTAVPIVEEKEPRTVNDILHVVFKTRSRMHSLPADLGWVVPGYTIDDLREETADISEWIEGAIRRQFTSHEVARKEAAKAELMNGRSLHAVSFPRETRTDNGLREGIYPEFWGGAVSFNRGNILEQIMTPAAASKLLGQIRSELNIIRGVTEGKEGDTLVRGGREGLNPARLYLKVPRKDGRRG